ncbi:MAG: DNA ligase [Gammaproteobacteria bacterium]|nr:MAG: DNA ligase [Gammaproteobacteria bacterium]
MSVSEREIFLRHELVVEEKVDGANLGISFDGEAHIRCQNRGEYLQYPFTGQWKKLSEWLTPKTDILFEKLTDRYILFGEWCYARHSVSYGRLPDWFLGFDIFDKGNLKFLSCPRRDAVFYDIDISGIPVIKKGRFTLPTLERTLSISRLSDNQAEGIYLRFDQGDWLKQRAKLVRPEFIQAVGEHWLQKGIKANQLKQGAQV